MWWEKSGLWLTLGSQTPWLMCRFLLCVSWVFNLITRFIDHTLIPQLLWLSDCFEYMTILDFQWQVLKFLVAVGKSIENWISCLKNMSFYEKWNSIKVQICGWTFLLHRVPKHRLFLDHWAIAELTGSAAGPACQVDGENSTYPEKHLIRMRIWNSAINCQNYWQDSMTISHGICLYFG